MIRFSDNLTTTGNADSLSTIMFSVFWRKWMTLLTVRNTSIRTSAVFRLCYILKMGWIYTRGVTAQVIRFAPNGKLVYEYIKRCPMCGSRFTPQFKPSVAIGTCVGSPDPARGSIPSNSRIDCYLGKETLEKFTGYGNAVRIVWNHLRLLFSLNGLGFRGPTHREALSFYVQEHQNATS